MVENETFKSISGEHNHAQNISNVHSKKTRNSIRNLTISTQLSPQKFIYIYTINLEKPVMGN